MTARVTIAIPCYKQEVFLFECLNSLIAQTMANWEAFVVDDCSPDNTIAQIVASYEDDRIRYVRHEENRGLAAARNSGIRVGKAPALLCLDADDFLHPEFFSAVLDAMEKDSADCAFTDWQCVGLDTAVWTFGVKTPDDLARTQSIPGPGTIMRRSIWERVGGYCEAPELRVGNEDWDFWIAAMSSGLCVVRVPRPLYFYRRHATSMGASVLPPIEWATREFILLRHPEFFAVGDRAKIFVTGGLLRSAEASRRTGHATAALLLTARAVAIDPKILIGKATSALRSGLVSLRNLLSRAISWTTHLHKVLIADTSQTGKLRVNSPRDLDTIATSKHHRHGYLSHDYSVLGDVIKQIGARCVLEIGCGSGRLIPVYLLHDMNPIWVHDVSVCALDICRRRFFHQKQIRYLTGSIESLALNARVDLVVSTCLLQHITDDEDVRRILSYLAETTASFFINEAPAEDDVSLTDPYTKGRDYSAMFATLGFRLINHGELEAEGGARQSWKLFERTECGRVVR